MAVMFFAKIDGIVRFKHEQSVPCLREAVCYTYIWGIKLPSSENAFIWGLIVLLFGFGSYLRFIR